MPYFECDHRYSKLVDLVEHAKFPIFASLNQSVETEALAFEQILYFAAVICNRYKLIVLSHIFIYMHYLFRITIICIEQFSHDKPYSILGLHQSITYFLGGV